MYLLSTVAAFATLSTFADALRVSTRCFGPCAEVPAKQQNILVAGAGGKTGREVVYQLLKGGHNVVALVRSEKRDNFRVPSGSAKLDGIHANKNMIDLYDDEYGPKLRIVQGSVVDEDTIADCFQQHGKISSVIVALGGKTNDVGNNMLSSGTFNILNHMRFGNCKRITAVTSVGLKESYSQAPMFFRGLVATIYKDMFKDKADQEYHLEKSDTTWCIVRPGGLTLEAPKNYVDVIPWAETIGTISRADVAGFCVRSVTDPEFTLARTKVSISNDKTHHTAE